LLFHLQNVLDVWLAVHAHPDRLKIPKFFNRKKRVRALDAEATPAVSAVMHALKKPVEFHFTVKAAKGQMLRHPRRRFSWLVVRDLYLQHRLLFGMVGTLGEILDKEELLHLLRF
jgi:hypothetical protein